MTTQVEAQADARRLLVFDGTVLELFGFNDTHRFHVWQPPRLALWTAVALARLGPALDHARSRQQTIERLRRTGTRHAGKLSERDFQNTWLGHDPIFRILVTYTAQEENRVVPAHMRTSQTRIPVVGSPMVLLTDETGAVHVELDHSAGVEFEKDDGRYAPSDG
jgi:hypothetical protein